MIADYWCVWELFWWASSCADDRDIVAFCGVFVREWIWERSMYGELRGVYMCGCCSLRIASCFLAFVWWKNNNCVCACLLIDCVCFFSGSAFVRSLRMARLKVFLITFCFFFCSTFFFCFESFGSFSFGK